jgi:hypothetical protein
MRIRFTPPQLIASFVIAGALLAPAVANAGITLPGQNSWTVESRVVSKDAAHTLAYGLEAPENRTVCTNCTGGEALTLGTFTGGTELTTFLTDVSCGETFLSTGAHAQVTQPGPLEWRIGWDDSGAPCGFADTDFNDLVATLTASYRFDGFFAPVDGAPAINVAKAGSSIPVKFGLNGDAGLDIFAEGYPASQPVACDSGLPTDPIEETTTANASGLEYDAAADQYVYVWKTNKAWAGTCRELSVKLNDGSAHTTSFQFK